MDDVCVVVAILARDKECFLSYYLRQLDLQTFPKHRIHLYIRTNNNTDGTERVLRDWIVRSGSGYASVFMNCEDVPELSGKHTERGHVWTPQRWNIMAGLRQRSVEYAIRLRAHYFVADCDNFVVPDCIESLVRCGLPVVAPMLLVHTGTNNKSSNFSHATLNELIHSSAISGLIQVELIHCTYLIRADVLQATSYDAKSLTTEPEFVRVVHNWKTNGIPLFVDNRKPGILTFAFDQAELEKESETMNFIKKHHYVEN
jgi:hypothetical protein